MKRITLAFAPYCSPLSPPYSIAVLSKILGEHATVFDANAFYFNERFPNTKADFKNFKSIDYNIIQEHKKKFEEDQHIQHNTLLAGDKPALFDEIINKICQSKPDVVAFSVIFSSQVHYTLAIVKELNSRGIVTVVGGPSLSEPLIKAANYTIYSFESLLEVLEMPIKIDKNLQADYSMFKVEDYFTPEFVLPIKTTSTCYYRQCAFCTHHKSEHYREFSLENIKKVASTAKNIFLIDDMISRKRLLELSKIFKPLGVKWMCQLKPTKEHDEATMQTLYDSGLRVVMWGVESGCQRVLDKMKKGTVVSDIENVLLASKNAGISNATFIMFGFPTETREEFMETIEFLKRNSENIDLVSTSVFGLQKGSPVYSQPELFGIEKVKLTKRTFLDPSITYTVKSGLTTQEAKDLRKKFRKTILNINKYPKIMNFYREQTLLMQE